MDDGGVLPLERREAGPVPVSNGLARTIQVDALLPPTPPPMIFQTYYFTSKVINYRPDTSLVSSVPCGLNRGQILCH